MFPSVKLFLLVFWGLIAGNGVNVEGAMPTEQEVNQP